MQRVDCDAVKLAAFRGAQYPIGAYVQPLAMAKFMNPRSRHEDIEQAAGFQRRNRT